MLNVLPDLDLLLFKVLELGLKLVTLTQTLRVLLGLFGVLGQNAFVLFQELAKLLDNLVKATLQIVAFFFSFFYQLFNFEAKVGSLRTNECLRFKK